MRNAPISNLQAGPELQPCTTGLGVTQRWAGVEQIILALLCCLCLAMESPAWNLLINTFFFFFFGQSKTQLDKCLLCSEWAWCLSSTSRQPGLYPLCICSLKEGRAGGCGLPWKTGGVRFRFTSYERLWFGRNHSVRVLVWLLWSSRRGGMRVPERLRWLLRVRMADRFLFPGFVFVLG